MIFNNNGNISSTVGVELQLSLVSEVDKYIAVLDLYKVASATAGSLAEVPRIASFVFRLSRSQRKLPSWRMALGLYFGMRNKEQ
eukprot:503943-Amphidinium_carterae.1